jgi:hypothetical protein
MIDQYAIISDCGKFQITVRCSAGSYAVVSIALVQNIRQANISMCVLGGRWRQFRYYLFGGTRYGA